MNRLTKLFSLISPVLLETARDLIKLNHGEDKGYPLFEKLMVKYEGDAVLMLKEEMEKGVSPKDPILPLKIDSLFVDLTYSIAGITLVNHIPEYKKQGHLIKALDIESRIENNSKNVVDAALKRILH